MGAFRVCGEERGVRGREEGGGRRERRGARSAEDMSNGGERGLL